MWIVVSWCDLYVIGYPEWVRWSLGIGATEAETEWYVTRLMWSRG